MSEIAEIGHDLGGTHEINATHAINSAAIRMIPPIPASRRPAVSLLARRTATIPHTAITANTAMATRARITRGGKFTTTSCY